MEVEVPNPELVLRPGMFVRTRVEFARHEDATLVPLAALVRRNDKEGIFIADLQNRKARFVPVTTGIISGELVEITEPEVSGPAVTMGNHLLEDGSDITIPEIETFQERRRGGGPEGNSEAIGGKTRSGDSQ